MNDDHVTAHRYRDDRFEGYELKVGFIRLQLTEGEADAAIAALQRARGAPEDCEGEGKCHGALQWCDACGDVSQVCDAPEGRCDCHAHCEHCGRLHSIDYECDEMKAEHAREDELETARQKYQFADWACVFCELAYGDIEIEQSQPAGDEPICNQCKRPLIDASKVTLLEGTETVSCNDRWSGGRVTCMARPGETLQAFERRGQVFIDEHNQPVEVTATILDSEPEG